jgi:hypothetical protein
MRFVLPLLAVLLAPAGWASDEASADAGEPDAAAKAEYVRLSQEIASLAEKSHWEGVDRAYRKASATGIPLSFADHMAGASASLALGDVAAARDRLQGARALHDDDPDVIESLWALDTAFARVVLTAETGTALTVAAVPFQSDQARAIAFAAEKVAETGRFEGYLPAGRYTLGSVPFEVAVAESGAEPVVVEAGPAPEKPRKRR